MNEGKYNPYGRLRPIPKMIGNKALVTPKGKQTSYGKVVTREIKDTQKRLRAMPNYFHRILEEGGFSTVIKATGWESSGMAGASTSPTTKKVTFIMASEMNKSVGSAKFVAAHEGLHGVSLTTGQWLESAGFKIDEADVQNRPELYKHLMLSDHPLIRDAYKKDLEKIPDGWPRLGLTLSHYFPKEKGGHWSNMTGAREEALAETMLLAVNGKIEESAIDKKEYREIFPHIKGDPAQLKEKALRDLLPRTLAVAKKLHAKLTEIDRANKVGTIQEAVTSHLRALPSTVEEYIGKAESAAIERRGPPKLDPQTFPEQQPPKSQRGGEVRP